MGPAAGECYADPAPPRVSLVDAPGVLARGTWLGLPRFEVERAMESSPMPGEPLLRDRAREAAERCKLSNRQHDRLRGGPRGGAPCRVCARPVEKNCMAFEVRLSRERRRAAS